MDRFIVVPISSISTKQSHLKSNMDRFIGFLIGNIAMALIHLKSNMDRFIGLCKEYATLLNII